MTRRHRNAFVPICVTIAGSDSGGGAGIQADLKAFSALRTYGASIITAITAQNTLTVSAVHDVPPAIIAAQMEAVFSDLAVAAVKIGMLSTPETIAVVAKGLANYSGPVVLDPVMISKSGNRLLSEQAVDALCKILIPRATLLTPNRPEAACLTGQPLAQTDAQAEEQGMALLAMGAKAVLMKGGHAEGATCTDILLQTGRAPLHISSPRLATQNTHGTGCTLSSAIAAGLAKGLTLADAFAEAHSYLHQAILAADALSVGHGHGPVHHFHNVWSDM